MRAELHNKGYVREVSAMHLSVGSLLINVSLWVTSETLEPSKALQTPHKSPLQFFNASPFPHKWELPHNFSLKFL